MPEEKNGKVLKIDIEKVFQEKNPRLANILPKFILNFIKRLIHQDDINNVLARTAHLKDIEFAANGVKEIGAEISSIGIENVPNTGRAIIAANHPLGGLDGVALISECGKVRQDVRFLVNDILLNLPNFETIFIPVNKHGANLRANLKLMEETFASEMLVLMFPAGLCSRKQADGQIMDLEWQKSFVAKAVRYGSPIIPTFITGKNTKRFYNIAYWRKKLGLKANIEMVLLPDEMFRMKGQSIQMIFGTPIPATTFDKRFSHQQWAQLLKFFIYELEKNPKASFEDFIQQAASIKLVENLSQI